TSCGVRTEETRPQTASQQREDWEAQIPASKRANRKHSIRARRFGLRPVTSTSSEEMVQVRTVALAVLSEETVESGPPCLGMAAWCSRAKSIRPTDSRLGRC